MSNGVWLRCVVSFVLAGVCFFAVGPATESAELTLSRMVWDFESVQQGDTPTQKIILKNTGADVAKVEKLELPAGFSVKPDLANKEIPAGGELEVEFALDSSGILGKLQQYAYIFVSDGKIVPLTIKGEVYAKAEPRLEVTPPEWDFGTVTVGESRQMSFRCKNTGTADLQLEKVQVYDSRFEVTRNIARDTLPPGEEVDFVVSLNPRYPGKCETDFYVKSNSVGRKYTKISAKGYAIAKTTGVIVSPDLSSVTNNTAFRLEVVRTDNLGREQTLMVNRDSQSSFTPEPGPERPNPENYTLTIKLAKAVIPTPPPTGVQPSAVVPPEAKPEEAEGVETPVPSPEGEPEKEGEQPPVTPEPEPPKEEVAPPVEKPEETKPETPTQPGEEKPSEPETEPTEKPSPAEPESGEPTVKPEKEEETKPAEPETEKPSAVPEKEESPESPPATAPETPSPEPPAEKPPEPPAEPPGSANK